MGWMQDRAKQRNGVGVAPVNPRADRLRSKAAKRKAPPPRTVVELDSEGEEEEVELDVMAMNRQVTRDAYEAREIEQEAPDRELVMAENAEKLASMHTTRSETVKANAKKMAEFHNTLRPVRSSQPTDVNKG